MVDAENSDDDDALVCIMNEIAVRLDLPLDETERGFTDWANRQLDEFTETHK